MMSPAARRWIETLALIRHPEGGWYRETYRSARALAADQLPARYDGSRPLCTAIYYLLAGDDVSMLHRLPGDELWHHYAGADVTLHLLGVAVPGGYETVRLGSHAAHGAKPQARVPGDCWFGATIGITPDGDAAAPANQDRYALVGCTMAPGFTFGDLELADRGRLCTAFPAQAELITRLTPPPG